LSEGPRQPESQKHREVCLGSGILYFCACA
jgi:hypothetical protein